MKKQVARYTMTILLLTIIIGCTPPHTPPKPLDPVLVKIETASNLILKDLNAIRGMEQARLNRHEGVQSAIRQDDIPTHGALLKPIAFSWYGPLEPAVKALAEIIGYKVEIEGRSPRQPKIVKIDSKGTAAYKVLADIGWQLGEKAGITATQRNKTLKVIYVGE